MTQHKIALAYCLENINSVEAFEELSRYTPYHFEHVSCAKAGQQDPLHERLRHFRGKILLLVSDNFLRNASCLRKGLRLMEERGEDVMPILLKGFRTDETGQVEPVPTRIEEVSDIIVYINYWQDKYQEARQAKEENATRKGQDLSALREISSEVGEYLRLLRKREPRSLDEIRAEQFEPFFEFVEDSEAADAFREAIRQPPEEELEAESALLDTLPGLDLLPRQGAEPAGAGASAGQGPEEEAPDWSAPGSVLEAAAEAQDAGNSDKAIALLREGIEAHPRYIPLRYQLALLLANAPGHLKDAEAQLKEVLDIDDKHADARFLQGEVAELREDFDKARSLYESLLEDYPDYPGIYFRLGLVLSNHFPEALDKAVEYLQLAVQAQPQDTDVLYHYAAAIGETEKNDAKAKELLQQVIDKQQDHPFAHYDLALIHYRQGNTDEARAQYLQAASNNPELRTPANDLAFEVTTERVENDPPMEEPSTLQDKDNRGPLHPPAHSSTTNDATAPTEDPLEDLKRNIERLEHMLKARKEGEGHPKAEGPKEDRIVLITGATSGIGRATAHLFARHGFRLIITGRRQERLDQLAKIFKELYHTEVKTLCYDVRDVEALKKVYSENLDFEWRQIDILINNAGKAKGLDPIYNGKLAHWEEMIDTNIKGLLYTTRAVLHNMVKRRTGHIINVASTAGKEVYPNGNVYCATKFAVDALTKAMRIDLVDFNIRVSQVSPGHVEQTEFAAVRFDGDEDRAKEVYDNFVPLNAHDVADAIYYIATRPPHVNIQDILMMGTQQAGASKIDRSGREQIMSFIQRIKPKVTELEE